MAIDTELPPRQFDNPEEVPIQAGPLKVNHKLIWKTGLGLIGLVFTVISAHVGVLWAGLALDAVLLLLYLLLIAVQPFEKLRTTPLAKLFRKTTHGVGNLLGWNTHRSPEIADGEMFLTEGAGKPAKEPVPAPIKWVGKVRFSPYELSPKTVPVGIVSDRRYDTKTLVIKVNQASLLMGSTDSQLCAHKGMLDDFANGESQVHRVVYRDQTFIGEPQNSESLVATLQKGANLTGEAELPHAASVKKDIERMGAEVPCHHTTITLTIHCPRVKRLQKEFGSYEQVLYEQMRALWARANVSGGNSALGWRSAYGLSYSQLIWENRLLQDPVFARAYWDQYANDPGAPTPLEQTAWSKSADFQPADHCRIGETYHMGFYVAGYPAGGTTFDQLWEIQKVRVPKTVSTVIEMIPAHIARRRAEWSTNGVKGTNEEREAAQRRVTEQQQLTAEEAMLHEREIARRNQVGRARCYVDVTGATYDEVRQYAAQVKSAAQRAFIALEPLTGRQELGIEAVLPLGRGLAAHARKYDL